MAQIEIIVKVKVNGFRKCHDLLRMKLIYELLLLLLCMGSIVKWKPKHIPNYP